jgi:hypothetical protein
MIGLKHVSINGQPYPVFYNTYGFALLMEKHDLSLGEVHEKIVKLSDIQAIKGEDLRFLYDFIYAGFIGGCKKEKIDFPYSAEDLMVEIGLLGGDLVTIFSAFSDSMPQVDPEGQKKVQKAPTRTRTRKKK